MKKFLIFALMMSLTDWSWGVTIDSEVIPRETEFYDLRCPLEQGESFSYWLLHGEGKAHFPSVTVREEEFTVYGNGSMIFKSIKIEHAGTHLCVKESKENTVMAHPVTLRVRPLPPDDLWGEVYQSQFLTGLIAALVCFAIFALSCLVYNRRWRPAKTGSGSTPIIENGYDNPALTGTEDDDSSTKM